jgi:hypothetical protein
MLFFPHFFSLQNYHRNMEEAEASILYLSNAPLVSAVVYLDILNKISVKLYTKEEVGKYLVSVNFIEIYPNCILTLSFNS